MKGRRDPGTGEDSETKPPGVKRNKHPSFYENVETGNIKVLSAEKDEKSKASPSPGDKSPTKPTTRDGLSSLRGEETKRRKCSINEHLLSEEEKVLMEREFPSSDEKHLEVTVTEVIPETINTKTQCLSQGREEMPEPRFALRARQMKLDWLDGKPPAGQNYETPQWNLTLFI